jgi:hypothetical protein
VCGWVGGLVRFDTMVCLLYHSITPAVSFHRPVFFLRVTPQQESQAAFDRPQPHDATHPLSIYEDYKFQVGCGRGVVVLSD